MLRSETRRQFAGFSLIGLVNTAIHLAVVTCLVEWVLMHPAVANGLAFVCANVFSFFANSRWTFRTSASLSRYLRFVSVSLVGLAISMAVSALGAALRWHYLAGVMLSFALLPVLYFAANKYWTWAVGGFAGDLGVAAPVAADRTGIHRGGLVSPDAAPPPWWGSC